MYSLGVLVERGHIQGNIDAEILQQLLTRLPKLEGVDAQAISNSLDGTAHLIDKGQLHGKINALTLENLLSLMTGAEDLSVFSIGFALHCLSRLAEK
ncbi:hypothetical protein BN59_00743 [Legionella massiliensis]|uniref:Uncharacterized protein n=1 Tax=Legionella massiliensis TaxID=1034943 RepID=A0A078KXI8_9GAMM|nr:hypothetical protein [Legionella massiliensis]CDZ76474.1 hypothetical protein BN59_00743 [Legionella massiliensis]CEE12212.1 hypothetical protein BN1094_00743 [Legionella massiliensis]